MDTTQLILLGVVLGIGGISAILMFGQIVSDIIDYFTEKRLSKPYKNESLYKDRIWDTLIDNYKKFVPKKYSDCGLYFSYNDRYYIIVWNRMKETGKCGSNESIYYTSMHLIDHPDCVLSSFNKKKSAKLAELLLEKHHDLFKEYNI